MKKPSLPNTDSGKVLDRIFDYLLPKATETIYKNRKYQVLPNGILNEADFIALIASKSLTKPWNQYKPIKDAQFYEEQQFIDYQREQEEKNNSIRNSIRSNKKKKRLKQNKNSR